MKYFLNINQLSEVDQRRKELGEQWGTKHNHQLNSSAIYHIYTL